MQFTPDYSIANENNSIAQDDNGSGGRDYEFTDENLKKVLFTLETKRKSDEPKIDFIKDCMPGLSKIKNMVDDIIAYYNKQFAPKEIISLEEDIAINIRFFMNKKSKQNNGDANSNEIRIFIKNFPDTCVKKVNGYGSFSEIIEGIPYGKDLWFQNYLRYILAHELFHIFHNFHYEKINKRRIDKNTVSSEKEDIIGHILMEVFAEYFAVSYIKYHLNEKECPESERNRMFNNIVDVGKTRLFGIGRKQLLNDKFSADEINEDQKQLNDLREKCEYKDYLKIDVDRGICTADYYGAHVFSGASRLYYDDRQGKDMPKFVSAYEKMLKGDRDDALCDIIKLKEKYFNDILQSKR